MTYYLAEIRFNRNKSSKREGKMTKRLNLRLIALLLISLLFSASITVVSVLAFREQFKSECWEEKELIIESLRELSSEISELPKEAFKSLKCANYQKKVLHIKIQVVIWQVKVGAYEGAINKLRNDIGDKIERWIVDPWKTDLIDKIGYIIDLIGNLCKDQRPPTIVRVVRDPETPNYNESVNINAQVIDEKSGVESVVLSYQINSTGWINVTMGLDEGLYVAEIPLQPCNTTVSYKVYSYDKAYNLATSETYSYLVIDSYPPIISHITQVPTSPNYNETVSVSANVTEPPEASGVKNVTLFYKTNGDWQPTEMVMENGMWTATIPGQSANVIVKFYVEAYDNVGNSAQTITYGYTVKAHPNLPPVAEFTESAETVLTGEVISFDASDSYDPDGFITNYLWDFGDGSNITVTSAFVDHLYSDDGDYTVTLTVIDNGGLTATATSTKTVSNRPPVASFTDNGTTVLTDEVIRFDASSSEDSDGYVISYLWDFDDGTTAVGIKVDHAYEDYGIYNVTLTVIDDDGATASTRTAKTVLNRPPVASFTANATVAKEGEIIHFDASESDDPDGFITNYFWDFGDGTNGEGIVVDHAYAEDGNYTVTLTLTDNYGASSSVSATIMVEEEAVGWLLALLAAISLGIAALTGTLLYGLYRRRKKKR